MSYKSDKSFKSSKLESEILNLDYNKNFPKIIISYNKSYPLTTSESYVE